MTSCSIIATSRQRGTATTTINPTPRRPPSEILKINTVPSAVLKSEDPVLGLHWFQWVPPPAPLPSTWATAWRRPHGVHTGGSCPQYRSEHRRVCRVGRGSRPPSHCSPSGGPAAEEEEPGGHYSRLQYSSRDLFSHRARSYSLSDQEGGALEWDPHQLVRVPGHRTGSAATTDLVSSTFRTGSDCQTKSDFL